MVVSIHAYVSIFPDSSCNTYKFVSAPEVHDAPGRFAFLDGGVVLCLPMFYLQGVVLFPEAILPIRVVQPRSLTAVDKAVNHVDAPCMIGSCLSTH
jgi:hypothetical protein